MPFHAELWADDGKFLKVLGLGRKALQRKFQLLRFLAWGAVSKCQFSLELHPWTSVRANSLS